MNKFLCTAIVAALGVTLVATDASAFGRRKKSNNNCCPQPVAYGGYGGGCGGCGGVAYGTVGGPAYASTVGGTTYASTGSLAYASAGYGGCGGVTYATVGQPAGYAMGQPYGSAMPMPMAGTTTTNNGVVTASANTPAGQQGMITVMVPTADAQVWFEDTQLPQTGKERTFKTPVIADGKSQTFNVKARWTNENGKAVEKTLPVSVKAGQTSTVDFR